jgi:hypothetical protein
MRGGLIFTLLLLAFCGNLLALNPAICKRTFSTYRISAENEVLVTVEINKGNITGIAKLVEEIPEGLTAYEGNSAQLNGVFTFEQQKLKIVWLNVPTEGVFKVTYKLKATGALKSSYHIIGKFSYLVNEVREEFFLSEGRLAGETNSNLQASVSKNVIVEDASMPAVDTAKTVVSKVSSSDEVKTSSSAAATLYKVQLGVFASKKDPSVFKTLKDISNEEVAGKYKYYSGSFSTKEEAEKRVEEAKKIGFSGAYIVSFVNGKRTN